ncbi:MAG: NrfD/PsrC family molybdoenzyme membrane anchor subunit [Candidatus Omnitrophota bacterium]
METKIVYDIFNLVYWDWRIAMDLFLGGLGVGAFLCAIALMFYKGNDDLVAVKTGAIIGPIGMTVGLLFMLAEMGQPLRIWKTWTRFNFMSTLSWGGILQQGFILFSAIFAIFLFTHKNREFRKKVAFFAGAFALLVAFYHGFLLSFVTARPLWNAGAISVSAIIGSISTGAAAVLFVSSFSEKGRRELKEMNSEIRNFLLALLFVQAFTCLIWLVTLVTGKADFMNAFIMLNKHFGVLFWFGAMLVGLVFPFLVLARYSFGERESKPIPIALVTAAILIGGFIFRYVLILGGQIS